MSTAGLERRAEALQVYLRIKPPPEDYNNSNNNTSNNNSNNGGGGGGGGAGGLSTVPGVDWAFDDTSIIEDNQNFEKRFTFSHCFGPKAYNRNVFSKVLSPALLTRVTDGHHAAVVGYGGQDAGKSWTCWGSRADPGLAVLCVQELLERALKMQVSERRNLVIKVSLLELMGEEVYDMFGAVEGAEGEKVGKEGERGPPLSLTMAADDGGDAVAKGARYVTVTKIDAFKDLLKSVQDRLQPPSSSSQANGSDFILEIRLESSLIEKAATPRASSAATAAAAAAGGELAQVRVSTIKFVDLSSNDGKITRYGVGSGRSIHAFNDVVRKLFEASSRKVLKGEKVFVPYRDSKLTRMLRSVLGGNCLTSLICMIAPGQANKEVSSAVINFGQCCRHISNQVIVSPHTGGIPSLDTSDTRDYDDSRAAFEEYESAMRLEIGNIKKKLEAETQRLVEEKTKLQAERVQVEDKEKRLGSLLTSLDEKDSKLRQLYDALSDQKEHLQRSIQDLKNREDVNNEWQRSFRKREADMQEIQHAIEARNKEMTLRDNKLLENETKLATKEREVHEKEVKVQALVAKLTAWQEKLEEDEKNLSARDLAMKTKEVEISNMEKETMARRREVEHGESLVREKEKKIAAEINQLDEREEELRLHEDKLRHRDLDLEKKMMECKQLDVNIREKLSKYSLNVIDLENREKAVKSKSEKLQKFEADLRLLESELSVWEANLSKVHEKFMGLDKREQELQSQIDRQRKLEEDFFNVQLPSVTQKQVNDLGELERLVERQLSTINTFQMELERAREELQLRVKEKALLERLLTERDGVISRLREELRLVSVRHQSDMNLGKTKTSASSNPIQSLISATTASAGKISNNYECFNVFSEPMMEQQQQQGQLDSRVRSLDINSTRGFVQKIAESQVRLQSLLNSKFDSDLGAEVRSGSALFTGASRQSQTQQQQHQQSPVRSQSQYSSPVRTFDTI